MKALGRHEEEPRTLQGLRRFLPAPPRRSSPHISGLSGRKKAPGTPRVLCPAGSLLPSCSTKRNAGCDPVVLAFVIADPEPPLTCRVCQENPYKALGSKVSRASSPGRKWVDGCLTANTSVLFLGGLKIARSSLNVWRCRRRFEWKKTSLRSPNSVSTIFPQCRPHTTAPMPRGNTVLGGPGSL